MKTMELKDKKTTTVEISKELNKYDNVVLFPEKLEKANKMLEKAGLPGKKK
jgi:hypothetical protein